MRDDFPLGVKRKLAERVNYHCSNPLCRKLTSGPNEDDHKSTLIGIAAHISAASKGGPRFDETLSSKQRKSITNGIWLCHNCSDLVDKDENKFPSEILVNWKKQTEDFIQSKISSSENGSKSLFNELMEIMAQLNSGKRISELLPKIFEVSIIHNLPELNEMSTREINGWYASDLPKFDASNLPKYRSVEVYLSTEIIEISAKTYGDYNLKVPEIFREFEKQEDINKVNYLFHESIKEIEDEISKYSISEEVVLSEKICANQVFMNGKLFEDDLQIWFSSSIYKSIESGLRKELNRKIINMIQQHRT